VADPVAVGDAEPLGDGQGVGGAVGLALALAVAVAEVEALLMAVADAAAEVEALGETLAAALPDAVGVGLRLAVGMQGVEACTRSCWLAGAAAVVPPRSSRAAGTTSKPRMTVITKASAPHSWSQNPREELRIRGRRPARAAAYCAC
jgi:hypothetical protein